MGARLYRDRIEGAASDKNSRLILAIDPAPGVSDLNGFAEKMIGLLHEQICAVKINFHLILPLSGAELAGITRLAHSLGLQCIADIKLNDIGNTNNVAIEQLMVRMGFDAVIVNPFIGSAGLKSLVERARAVQGGGIIALVYMSHPGASEGFGLQLEEKQQLYRVFLERAEHADADGIVVGASQLSIIKEVSDSSKIPIYSPGIGAQGGDARTAVSNGANYLIVGRSIIESKDPVAEAKRLKNEISHLL